VQAFDDRHELLGPLEDNWQEVCLAAALRAAADQVVPYEKAPKLMRGPDLERLAQRQHTRAQMLALVCELEAL